MLRNQQSFLEKEIIKKFYKKNVKKFEKTLDSGFFIMYSSLTVCGNTVDSKWTLTTAYCKSKTNI